MSKEQRQHRREDIKMLLLDVVKPAWRLDWRAESLSVRSPGTSILVEAAGHKVLYMADVA
jgi:hypothetical protein